jgi:hypothetical protein
MYKYLVLASWQPVAELIICWQLTDAGELWLPLL